jgi:hypothetical protein
MRVALLTTFVASKKEPLGEMLQRIHQAFSGAGLGEPAIRFNFGDAPLLVHGYAAVSSAQVPQVQDVVVVLEENTDYADVCGPNNTSMPL